ncbi:hypothetical protein RUM43_007025 [Polyplax serrata]|uniref:Uncharacterized protein n=1 Tax=Polyplax serrata TaxID=468196 RepID=A0AAN8PLF8_POLSC
MDGTAHQKHRPEHGFIGPGPKTARLGGHRRGIRSHSRPEPPRGYPLILQVILYGAGTRRPEQSSTRTDTANTSQ